MKEAEREYIIDICPECKVRENDSSKKRLFKCHLCQRYFCEKHLPPRLTIMRSAIEEIKDKVLRDKVYEEWRKTNGHPDVVWTEKYFEKLKIEEEKKSERFWEVVEGLEEAEKEVPKHVPKISLPPKFKYHQVKNSHLKNVLIGIVILALVAGFLFFLRNEKILSFSNIVQPPSEPKYVQDCLNKAKEAIELERMRSTIDFKWKILEYKEFSSPSEAEAYAKDRVTFPGSYVICKKKCSFTECKDIVLPTKILAIIYEERAYFQGSEIKATDVIYCGNDGRLLEKGSTDTC
jgi:hypothetical protein